MKIQSSLECGDTRALKLIAVAFSSLSVAYRILCSFFTRLLEKPAKTRAVINFMLQRHTGSYIGPGRCAALFFANSHVSLWGFDACEARQQGHRAFD